MLKTSKLPTGQTLENFDFAFQPAIERSRIETLATGAGCAFRAHPIADSDLTRSAIPI